jgi:hypothetical protein
VSKRTTVVLEARRSGSAFDVEARDLGALPGIALDDIAGLLDQIEGPEHR